MPKPHHTLSQTTSVPFETAETDALRHAIERRDIAGAETCLADGAHTDLECLSFIPEIHNDDVDGLTATSFAALADCSRGELLFLPLMLNRGGNIHQVDSRGRTLLHFAWHEVVARYLLEHGAPVPDGLRAPLLEALDLPAGEALALPDGNRGYLDADGHPVPLVRVLCGEDYPWFERTRRPVPAELASDLVSPSLASAMADAGYTCWPGHHAGAGGVQDTPPLLARFDASVEIEHALRERDTRRVDRLLKLGAMEGSNWFSFEADVDDVESELFEVDALGLTVLMDCRFGEVLLTPLFEGFADFEGPHGEGDETLLHLAVDPWVCKWLLARGLSPDEVDANGSTPAETLPSACKAVIDQWQLDRALPAATGEGRGSKRL